MRSLFVGPCATDDAVVARGARLQPDNPHSLHWHWYWYWYWYWHWHP